MNKAHCPHCLRPLTKLEHINLNTARKHICNQCQNPYCYDYKRAAGVVICLVIVSIIIASLNQVIDTQILILVFGFFGQCIFGLVAKTQKYQGRKSILILKLKMMSYLAVGIVILVIMSFLLIEFY